MLSVVSDARSRRVSVKIHYAVSPSQQEWDFSSRYCCADFKHTAQTMGEMQWDCPMF